MRTLLVALSMLLGPMTSAHAQISVQIGINMPAYPELVQVPDYPVYYAPRANANYFFYDGLYWVYQGDDWYASSWYNGPWQLVGREDVPPFVLRIPVRYYRRPPPYFRGWPGDAPPRWGEHWGRDWEQRRGGWDRWDHRSAPPPAPLPVYQRQYSGDRYPRTMEKQRALHSQSYRYQPHEAVTQQRVGHQGDPRVEPHQQAPVQQRPAPPRQPSQANPQRQPAQPSRPQPATAAQQRRPNQPPPTVQRHQAAGQDRGQESKRDRGHENKSEEHGQDRH